MHMKTRKKFNQTLCIDIITFKSTTTKHTYKGNYVVNNMDTACLDKRNKSHNKFICSICLNQKCFNEGKEVSELNERKSRSCPVCQCCCRYSTDNDSVHKISEQSRNNYYGNNTSNTRDVQTSQADVTHGLSLLNEVLNVFQNKKQLNNKERKSKTVIFKDIGVSTEDRIYRNTRPKLSMSKMFHWSIEDKMGNGNKFTIVTSSQPENIFTPRISLDLIHHKSSSIPQMKLDELKNSLKTKTKSKDVIEEANRMFATVKRTEENDNDRNRPMVRSGPRVLPVVKTDKFIENVRATHSPNTNIDQVWKKQHHENNYNMSSGDSIIKNKCFHKCDKCTERCDECVFTCCHHHQNKQLKELVCQRCHLARQES